MTLALKRKLPTIKVQTWKPVRLLSPICSMHFSSSAIFASAICLSSDSVICRLVATQTTQSWTYKHLVRRYLNPETSPETRLFGGFLSHRPPNTRHVQDVGCLGQCLTAKHGQHKHVETTHFLIDLQRPETQEEGMTGHPPKNHTKNETPSNSKKQRTWMYVFAIQCPEKNTWAVKKNNNLALSTQKKKRRGGLNLKLPNLSDLREVDRAAVTTPKAWVCCLWPVEADGGALFILPGSSPKTFFDWTGILAA